MSETATTRRLVVGYIATDRGRDAMALAISIARSIDIELVVTIVRPESSTILAGSAVPKDGAGIVAEQIDEWLEEAMALVPDDVAARGVIHVASNEAKGLMEVAEEEGAQGIGRPPSCGSCGSARSPPRCCTRRRSRSSSPLTAGPTSVRSLA